MNKFTQERLSFYRSTLGDIATSDSPKDPIHQLFFKKDPGQDLGEFLFERQVKTKRYGRNHRRQKAKSEVELAKKTPQVPPAQQPIQLAQSSEIHTIAAPTTKKGSLRDKKRRSRSVTSYLAPSSREKIV